jgi:GDP-mannose 6-dehydrogenase
MNITVVGLGYVGTVSLVSLASRGHRVWGVDINPQKLESLRQGIAPIVEPGLQQMLSQANEKGLVRVGDDVEAALRESDVCFVSVATPSQRNGHIDSRHLLNACGQIAQAMHSLGRRQIVAIRSSILPTVLADVEELFELNAPGLVDLCVNPEFLREGTAIADFEGPPFTLIGTASPGAEAALRSIYSEIEAPVYVLPAAEATLVKYASNAYHALKATFANEIGRVCSHMGIDGDAVMQVFCKDTKLNISANYLRPGFAFGGSCLPKDVRALQYAGRLCDIELPLMSGILDSNAFVVRSALQAVLDSRARRVALIGLSFKRNTDDLRESPYVELAEQLIGKGIELRIYDPNVSIARLTGANKEYINGSIPHLSRLLVSSIEEATSSIDLLILAHRYADVEQLDEPDLPYAVLDLTGQMKMKQSTQKRVSQL